MLPSVSILAEPRVTIIDKVVDKHGTRKVAEAYLKYLYTPEGQEIAAKNYYRPRLAQVAAKYSKQFPELRLFTIDGQFADGKRRRSSTLPTVASSTGFISRGVKKALEV